MSTGASTPDINAALDQLMREQMEALNHDTREAAGAIRKYQDDAAKRYADLQEKMFGRDPRANAPPAVRITLQIVEQKLLAMPVLAPYVLNFVLQKIKEVGEATKNALGPLPELDPDAAQAAMQAAGFSAQSPQTANGTTTGTGTTP